MKLEEGHETVLTTDRHGGLNTIIHIDHATTIIKILYMMEHPHRHVELEPFQWPGDSPSSEKYNVRITSDEHGGLNVIVVISRRTGLVKAMYMMEDGRQWRALPSIE